MNPLEISAARNRWSAFPVSEKLFFFLGLLLWTMVLPPSTGAPIVLAVTIFAVIVLARVQWRLFCAVLGGVTVFIVIGAIPLAVSVRSGIHVETSGLSTAIETVLRATAASAATLGLATTTQMAEILDWSRRRGLPLALCHVVDLTYRLIGVLLHTALSLRSALDLRLGLRTRAGSITAIGTQFATVFVSGLKRAQAMSDAMQIRAEPGSTAVLTRARPVSGARVFAISVSHVAVVVAALAVQLLLVK